MYADPKENLIILKVALVICAIVIIFMCLK